MAGNEVGQHQVGVGGGEGGAPGRGEDDVGVVVAEEVADGGMAIARVAGGGGAAVALGGVGPGGYGNAFELVFRDETAVVGELGDVAGGIEVAESRREVVGCAGTGADARVGVSVSVRSAVRLGVADAFGAAGDEGGDGVFEGGDAAGHPAEDGGGRLLAGAGGTSGGTFGSAGGGGGRGGWSAGSGTGRGSERTPAGVEVNVEEVGEGIDVPEGFEVAAGEAIGEDGVVEGDLESSGGVVVESGVGGQGGDGVRSGAAQAVGGQGDGIDGGISNSGSNGVAAGGWGVGPPPAAAGGGGIRKRTPVVGGGDGIAGAAEEVIAAGQVVVDGSFGGRLLFRRLAIGEAMVAAGWQSVGSGVIDGGYRGIGGLYYRRVFQVVGTTA